MTLPNWLQVLLLQLSWCCLLLACLLICGCSGCRDQNSTKTPEEQAGEANKKKVKPKPDFVSRDPILLPGIFPKPGEARQPQDNSNSNGDNNSAMDFSRLSNASGIRNNRTKPGHWAESHFQIIANNYDADGQLKCEAVDSLGQSVCIPHTNYALQTVRPAALPKGEWKNLETSVYIPLRESRTITANINYSFSRRSGGVPVAMTTQPTTLLKPFQFHVVLLSERPEFYNFLKMIDSVQLHGQRLPSGDLLPPFYNIVPTVPGDPLPLPRHALNWTTIAYLIWDDFDPSELSADHQTALVDWLHFGGQLILSGPDCLDKLQSSFLADYLPAHFESSRKITNTDVEKLNQAWTVPVRRNESEKRHLILSDSVPLRGIEFKPHLSAQFVDGTGDLVIERSIGRGRVVATAFSLSVPLIRKWQSFPSFFNGALLRRPEREFSKQLDGSIAFEFLNGRQSMFDPLIGSTVRWTSRDLSENGTSATPAYSINEEYPSDMSYGVDFEFAEDEEVFPRPRRSTNAFDPHVDPWRFGGYADVPQSGIGGWNDQSGVAIAARKSLKDAAGITPPSSKFVLKMLAGYLLVLVPLNWLFFRCLNRVEWAWIAAPFIAIAGAIVVVKMAALDIGFVRSNTQIGMLEIHADHARGHLSEFSALYTSLSTGYQVALDNPTAQALPFAISDTATNPPSNVGPSIVQLNRAIPNRLQGFQIQSNSTGLLHNELMLDLDGQLHCQCDDQGRPQRIDNGTSVNLNHVGVLYRDLSGRYYHSWIGDLNSQSSTSELKLNAIAKNELARDWKNAVLFHSSEGITNDLWNKHFGDSITSVSRAQIQEIPEFSRRWEEVEPLFFRLANRQELPPESERFTKNDLLTVFRMLHSESSIRLGLMFDNVMQRLEMGKGECRLIGATQQRLGRTRFEPDATQSDVQTLVLAHLKRPPLPPAKRDLNAYIDFTGKSNLDYENENQLLDEFDDP